MSSETLASARRGFDAWQRGDFVTVEALLDPNVWWRWFEPGDWDCKDRTDVMRTLRQRYEEGFARAPLELLDVDDDVIVAVARPREAAGAEWSAETATVITFRDDRVVSMQDFRTKDEALAWSAEGRGRPGAGGGHGDSH